ncbi:unnamed protein product [Cutaneotrichosporon oleaginosum]
MALFTALSLSLAVTILPVLAILLAPRNRPSSQDMYLHESLQHKPLAEATMISARRHSIAYRAYAPLVAPSSTPSQHTPYLQHTEVSAAHSSSANNMTPYPALMILVFLIPLAPGPVIALCIVVAIIKALRS